MNDDLAAERERLLDVAFVARKIGVDARTLRRWIVAGKCAAARTLGGHYRIPAVELHRLEKKVGQAGQVGHTR